MIDRFLVNHAMLILGYKKRESFNRWCRLNHVPIYSYKGSNKHFVIHNEFFFALHNKTVLFDDDVFKIKKKSEMFNSFMKVSSEINTLKDQSAKEKKIEKYKPDGDIEKTYLSKFVNIAGVKRDELYSH